MNVGVLVVSMSDGFILSQPPQVTVTVLTMRHDYYMT